jgi:hypothetical protein
VAAISLAMLVSPHVRQHWQGWCGALLLAILIALAPMNRGYRADIIFALSSSVVRSNPLKLLLTFSYDRLEQTLVLGQVIALIYLMTRQCARLADVLIGLFIWASGFFLLTQNVQPVSIPLSWDLLFILDGAWRLYTGQVLHVDFHYPIGTLPFLITILGFHLVGIALE